MYGDEMAKVHVNISVENEILRTLRMREEPVNISKICEEALAKEAGTGVEIERLKDKIATHRRKYELYSKELEACEELLEERLGQEELAKLKQEELNKTTQLEQGIEKIMEHVRLRHTIPDNVLQQTAFDLNMEMADLALAVREKAGKEGVSIA